jgi:hypothetical protein
MPSSGMLRHVALEGTDVSEEHSAYMIRVTRTFELVTMLAGTSNRFTIQRDTYLIVNVNFVPSLMILVTLMK